MKTIFITISRGGIARNILKTNFFTEIKKEFDRVIILSPAFKDKRFNEEFFGPGVEIINLPEPPYTKVDELISRINSFLIYNRNTIRLSLYDYVVPPSRFSFVLKYIKYILLRIIFQPLSYFSFIRKLLRKIDEVFTMRDLVKEYQELIKEYSPNLIFSTSIVEDTEVALMRAAKRQGIIIVSMPKSWDNSSKRYFRVKADKLVVWSNFMIAQAKKLQDYKDKEIIKVGISQFDFYQQKDRIKSREEFCTEFNLDPNKRIILFGSEGKMIPSDKDVAEVLVDLIKNNELLEPSQLLIRPHFGYKDDELKFKNLVDQEGVVVDYFNNPSNDFRDRWDYSDEHINRFVNSIYHSDVVISTCSTLVLDGVAVGKPGILINFDGYNKKSFYESVSRWYVCDYFESIFSFNAVPLVGSVFELRNEVNKILKGEDAYKDKREKLKEYFCYKVDGCSGKRLAKYFINW